MAADRGRDRREHGQGIGLTSLGPVRPAYDGGCISNVVGQIIGPRDADWLPSTVRDADAVVLLVLDGLPSTSIERHAERVPTLRSLQGGPITSVVPSTTPTALTSITTGVAPSEHGMVGYRFATPHGVLNAIRWKIHGGRAKPPDPTEVQPIAPFGGRAVPVVAYAAFKDTGFSHAYLRGCDYVGVHAVSGIVEGVRAHAREPFVYAYYDGLDLVSHMHGMRDDYMLAELSFCDRLVSDLLDAIPGSTALVVTADHGHVHFDGEITFSEVGSMVATFGGESRFKYLYAKPGAASDLLDACADAYGDRAWIFTRAQLFDEGWLGPRAPSHEVAQRVGDVIVAAREPVQLVDPTNPGEQKLLSGHGSLTPDEMLVPLLAGRGRA